MPHITTCRRCGGLYEETNEEAANAPDRLCAACWRRGDRAGNLERRLGRDDAMAVARSIEASLSHIEERSREIAMQRKLEAKEALRMELRDELATKEDIANVRSELKQDIADIRTELIRLDKKFTILFMATIFTVLFVNQNALEFLARLLGLIR